jgi:hypothetical protein
MSKTRQINPEPVTVNPRTKEQTMTPEQQKTTELAAFDLETAEPTDPSQAKADEPTESEISQAFEKVLPNLLSLNKDRILLRNPCSVAEGTGRGLWVAMNYREDRPLFLATYQSMPTEAMDDLYLRALALKGAATVTTEVRRAPSHKRGQTLCKKFTLTFRSVFFEDHDKEQELQEAIAGQRGRKVKKLGDRLIAFAKLGLEHRGQLCSTGLMASQDFHEMEALGLELLAWRVSKRQPIDTDDLVRRAFTYMAESYNFIRTRAFVIYENDPTGWESRYPDLASRVPRVKHRKSEEKDLQQPEESTKPTDDAISPPDDTVASPEETDHA